MSNLHFTDILAIAYAQQCHIKCFPANFFLCLPSEYANLVIHTTICMTAQAKLLCGSKTIITPIIIQSPQSTEPFVFLNIFSTYGLFHFFSSSSQRQANKKYFVHSTLTCRVITSKAYEISKIVHINHLCEISFFYLQ